MSIEATPLELSEEQAGHVLDLLGAAEAKITSGTSLAILCAIGRETLLHGHSTSTHAGFGRMTGACRRSIDTAIKRLKRHDLIARVETGDGGTATYRANFRAAGTAVHDMG